MRRVHTNEYYISGRATELIVNTVEQEAWCNYKSLLWRPSCIAVAHMQSYSLLGSRDKCFLIAISSTAYPRDLSKAIGEMNALCLKGCAPNVTVTWIGN